MIRIPFIADSPVFRVVRTLPTSAPVVFYTILVLVLAELVVALVLPLVIPDRTYLRHYLSQAQIERTQDFLEGRDPFLVWDGDTGWNTRPNSGLGLWQADEHGARTTHRIPKERTEKRRILFLGNSLTNGGSHVTAEETMSAYIEDENTESLNFATMLYSVDQMYLAFDRQLLEFQPDVVAVGIGGDPFKPLFGRFVPFFAPWETNVPYFKPRFMEEDGEYRLLLPPDLETFSRMLDEPGLLEELEETDGFYHAFVRYKRSGNMPVAGSIALFFEKCRNLARLMEGFTEEEARILMTSLTRLKASAESVEARFVVMVFPEMGTAFPGGWRRSLPDHFGTLLSLLESEGLEYLDVREAFWASGISPWVLYAGDGIHFLPEGNKVIADALRQLLAGPWPSADEPRVDGVRNLIN